MNAPQTETWQQRLRNECADLAGRYERLDTFLDESPAISIKDRDLLMSQLDSMGKYLAILELRIKGLEHAA